MAFTVLMEFTLDQFVGLATARHCKRAFLDRPVPRHLLEQVLATAGNAPSTRNGQPWRVEVVTGDALDALVNRLFEEWDRKTPPRLEYGNRVPNPEPFVEERAKAAAAGAFQALGITGTGEDARRAHMRMNMQFYGAPLAMVGHLPVGAPGGTFLELGLFLQNVMLGLVAAGLGSCPQSSVACYPDVVREQLGLGPDRLVVCTLSVGYPDPAAPINAFIPPRASVTEYTRWHDQLSPGLPAHAIRAAAAEV
jgi:nitroreductase